MAKQSLKKMFPHIKKDSFFSQIFSSLILGGLLPSIFLTIVLCILAVSILSTSFKNQLQEAITNAAELTEEFIESLEIITYRISEHRDVLVWAQSKTKSPDEILKVNKVISELIESPYVQAYLLPLDGAKPISRNIIPEEYSIELYGTWGLLGALKKIQKQDDFPIIYTEPHKSIQGSLSFAFASPIFIQEKPVAYLILDIERNELSQKLGLSSFSSAFFSDLFLVDKKNTILYSAIKFFKEGSVYKINQDEKVLEIQIPVNDGLRLIGSYTLSTIEYFTKRIQNLSFIFIGLSFCIFFIMALLLSRLIARPIEMLTKTMRDVSYGNLDLRCDTHFAKNAELLFLIQSYNTSLDQIRDLYLNRIAQERSLRHAQVQALQAQINPHFLNNTLNSIKSMALLDGNKDIAEMISSLARIFRQSISLHSEFSNLKESISIAKDYFTIEAKRWPGRFTLIEDVNENLYDAIIPHLVLQAIFENALQHGLENKEGPGKLWLKAWVSGGDLFIEVKDDGIGIDPKELENIKNKLDRASLDPELTSDLKLDGELGTHSGIALINTHRRLSLIFGKTYGLHIESKKGEGTKVLVCLPYKKGDTLA